MTEPRVHACRLPLAALAAALICCGCRSGAESAAPGALSAVEPSAPAVASSSPVVPAGAQWVEGVGWVDQSGQPLDVAGAATPEYHDEPERGIDFDFRRINVPGPEELAMKFRKLIGLGPNEVIARQLYAEGDALFREGRYTQAARKYRAASKRWPDSHLEEDSLFMLGESYFFADRYAKADDSFNRLYKKYDNTRHLDTSVTRQFAIARYWEQTHRQHPRWPVVPNLFDPTLPWFDTLGNALGAYESVRLNDPTGPLADASIMATANAYFLDERYEDADYYYGLIRSDYPQSEHQATAHLLGLRAKMLKYQGPHYDGVALSESLDLIEQMQLQFPDQLASEMPRIRQAEESVHAQMAQREYEMAEFYTKTKHHRAARYYYESVMRNYSDTAYADLARERMGDIADLPDEPRNYFAWLEDVLPETKRR